ncbi:MAG: patatin-like phospholipase family protein [Hylemonella sp.]|nr:patatin-like phospholipase family protein [Hylemonella sp.]
MSGRQALRIFAGPVARAHLEREGLRACDIRTIPAAAGGPKGLILGPLDRFIFGRWLAQSSQPVDLVGASIGAWRMATACLDDPAAALALLEDRYIHQHYEFKPGNKRPAPALVSERFGQSLQDFYGGRVQELLAHPRYRLHLMTSRGRHLLRREHALGTPIGYLGAFLSNAVHRKALGAWLERVVFSTPGADLPFLANDYRTCQLDLNEANFMAALQASCSIPFVLEAVHRIPGAPAGAYWDGGITDYHLHLDYAGASTATAAGLVLYPHFQQAVVPGWLDKSLRWRHRATRALDNMVLLAPDPEWVRGLPGGKLPDRSDFLHFGNDLPARVKAWQTATQASQQLAEEFEAWLDKPDMRRVQAL